MERRGNGGAMTNVQRNEKEETRREEIEQGGGVRKPSESKGGKEGNGCFRRKERKGKGTKVELKKRKRGLGL
jgi:hypothetical protein